MRSDALAFLLTVLTAGGHLQSAEPTPDRLNGPTGRIEMVLDSDMYNEVDDQFALAFAVRSPERIDLKAVYAAPFLNHRSKSAGDGMDKSYRESLRVLEVLGARSEGRVFRGSGRFLADRNTPVDSPAARHLIRLAHQDREGPLYVVGLGAATNLASALLIDPTICSRIVVVWIGGHPHSWPHARDFNLKQDIAAAQVLFDSGVPLVHVPAGDVAAALTITLPELEAGLKGKSPIADALYQNVDGYYTETGASKNQPRSGPDAWRKVIWDIATVAWLLEPEKMVTSQVVPSPVLTDDGTWKRGEGRHAIRVAVKLDRDRVFEVLFQRLAGTVVPPYPASPAIAAIEWAPLETVVRRAKGSDNFPLTWSDDDALYTTYGDGFGFEPFVPAKLSLGLARITGTPDDFQAVNLRSDSIEQYGDGRKGRKGWGLLSVEGVLYLWLGHADRQGGQAQLAWSQDHGRTWTFADWRFEQFGLVGFINFGKDYAGARDDYVYAYSHDGPQADRPADRFVLMRVPRERITRREAWEFFVRRDEQGRPVWSDDASRRGAVFEHPDACLRSAVTYNAEIRRYLWWQAIPQPPGHRDRGDTRFDGGFGIYDAPEPWGPWTTVYFTRQWDTGPGEHGDFPSKWMRDGGRTLYLVFSGDDRFSLRKATLKLRGAEALPPRRERGAESDELDRE